MSYLATYFFYPIVERYLKRDVRSKITVLRRHYQRPFAERKQYIQRALADRLQFAGRHVPYYRDLFRSIGFSPEQIRQDINYIQKVPLLSKEIILEQGDRMLNEEMAKDRLIVSKTGGSTGPSMLVYYSQEAVDWTSATNQVVLEWAGRKRHMKELHLASRFPEVFPLRDRIKEHIKCLAMNRTNIFTHSFNDDDLNVVFHTLKKRKPYLIQGHPSTLFALANFLDRKQIDAKRVITVFESTGEVLDSKKREKIEAVFGCRCVDRYGNAEVGVIAYETPNSNHYLQVTDYMVYPESLPTGQGGNEIVLTGLTNDAMPFIRYRTGDLGDLVEKHNGYHYARIQGRVHDMITIGQQQYPTHYVQDLLDRIGGIEEFQMEQQAYGKIMLRLVLNNDHSPDAIEGRLRSWWGDHIDVEFTCYNGLKRVGWRGKFRYLV